MEYKINGIQFHFPYKPYPSQIISISKIIDAFRNKNNSLIEVPTGNGKSLSIIMAACGWLYNQKDENKKSKIIICSRTHNQLSQLIETLKQTKYNPKTTVLASRKIFCVNKEIQNDFDLKCKELRKKNLCNFFKNKERVIKKIQSNRDGNSPNNTRFIGKNNNSNILDIEDIKNISSSCKGCPYYTSRLIIQDSDIIFMPYSYLLDPVIRKSIDISYKNCNILIDEAHNLDDFLCEAGSVSFTRMNILFYFKELQNLNLKFMGSKELKVLNFFLRKLAEIIDSPEKTQSLKENQILENSSLENNTKRAKLESTNPESQKENQDENHVNKKSSENCGLENDIQPLNLNWQVKNANNQSDYLLKGTEIKKLLNFLNINPELINLVKSQSFFNKSSELAGNMSLHFLQFIERIMNCLILIEHKNYGLVISTNDKRKNNSDSVKFILMDPSAVFHSLSFNSLSLLSGTLSPFSNIEESLKSIFKNKLIAPSLFKNNLFIRQISRNKDILLKCDFNNMKNQLFIQNIIEIILKIQKKVHKGGILVFLPSYGSIQSIFDKIIDFQNKQPNFNNSYDKEKKKNYSEKLSFFQNKEPNFNNSYGNEKKKNYSEKLSFFNNEKIGFKKNYSNKTQNNFKNIFMESPDNFDKTFKEYSKACLSSNPILLAVYRGKASEGTNFKDHLCRSVILVGMPFPNIKDVNVIFQRERKNWYKNSCYRALNQAVGRCIRHGKDWSSVFLLDSRIEIDYLSLWIKKEILNENFSENILRSFEEFINEKERV